MSNFKPVLIYYPYGKGTVILTSLFTDYELYDAEGNLVQWSTEADSGRFGILIPNLSNILLTEQACYAIK